VRRLGVGQSVDRQDRDLPSGLPSEVDDLARDYALSATRSAGQEDTSSGAEELEGVVCLGTPELLPTDVERPKPTLVYVGSFGQPPRGGLIGREVPGGDSVFAKPIPYGHYSQLSVERVVDQLGKHSRCRSWIAGGQRSQSGFDVAGEIAFAEQPHFDAGKGPIDGFLGGIAPGAAKALKPSALISGEEFAVELRPRRGGGGPLY
jgi:hypothetical protein